MVKDDLHWILACCLLHFAAFFLVCFVVRVVVVVVIIVLLVLIFVGVNIGFSYDVVNKSLSDTY